MHKTLLLALALLLVVVPPAGATWSIVLINNKTHEVAIGSATCLAPYDLELDLPLVRVERGAAAAQSIIKAGALIKMWDAMVACQPPDAILATVLDGDNGKAKRQYGIASMCPVPAAIGYTGTAASQYKEDVTGTDGDLTWAIQGNVLTGAPVIAAAQLAVVSTPGTLADKLMAGMLAAYSMGGDGRCSCNALNPTGCGSPPVNGFTKSAHIGFMIVARPGDIDGVCNAALGCANGSYWLNFNVKFAKIFDLDPVLQMQAQYAAFVLAAKGHADGLQSLAAFDHAAIVGDGSSTTTLHVALLDLDGQPVLHGGAAISVGHAAGSAGLSSLLAVDDHGDGTYELLLQAGRGEGLDLLAVHVDDGFRPTTLFPYPALLHRPSLVAAPAGVSAAAGGTLSFDLLAPSGLEGRRFSLALSAAGSAPGQLFGTTLVPLNADRLFAISMQLASQGMITGVPGTLDPLGVAVAAFDVPAAALLPLAGQTLSAAWFTVRPLDYASNAVSFAIEP